MARFTDVFEDVTRQGRKIPTNLYLESGLHPIIDQGQSDIAGYTNETSGLFTEVPAIVFGDHTRIIKYVDIPCFLGADGVKLLKAKDANANHKYLYYVLCNAKIPNTGYSRHFKWLKEVEIPDYSAQEQNDIVAQFEGIDQLIHLRQKQLSKLDELVKSRFIEMFGAPTSNPMNWNKERLKDNATLLNGRAYKQEELLDDGKYPVLRVGNFFSNRGWYYSNLELDEDKYCDTGDLLYTWSASFGPRIWTGGKVIYHYHIWKIIVGEKYNKQFLCNLLEYSTASFMSDTHGIAMMHLTKNGMEETEFIIPPIDLQNQFAAFVEQTDKLNFEVKEALEKLEILKKSLMQKYFGKRRIIYKKDTFS